MTFIVVLELFWGLRTDVCHVHSRTKCKQCFGGGESNTGAPSLDGFKTLAYNSEPDADETNRDSNLTPRK